MKAFSWMMLTGGLLALAAPAAGQTTLRFKFQKGDKLAYVLETKNRTVTSTMGKDVESEAVQTIELTWHVDAVDEAGAQATIKFGRVKVVMEGPKGKVELDSASDKEPEDEGQKPLFQAAKALAKVEVTCTAAPTGELSKLTIKADELKALKRAGGSFADNISEDGLKRMLLGGVILPKGEIEKDKEWTDKLDMKTPIGQITGTVHFSLDGTVEQGGKKLHKIAIKPDVTLKPKQLPMVEFKVKGPDSKGFALFDQEAGRLMEVSGTQTMELSAEINSVAVTQQLHATSAMRHQK